MLTSNTNTYILCTSQTEYESYTRQDKKMSDYQVITEDNTTFTTIKNKTIKCSVRK